MEYSDLYSDLLFVEQPFAYRPLLSHAGSKRKFFCYQNVVNKSQDPKLSQEILQALVFKRMDL